MPNRFKTGDRVLMPHRHGTQRRIGARFLALVEDPDRGPLVVAAPDGPGRRTLAVAPLAEVVRAKRQAVAS